MSWLIPYSPLDQEFNPDQPLGKRILEGIEEEMYHGRFTLGPAVQKFEEEFAKYCEVKYAVGVGSGTDALILILKTLNVWGQGIITVPNTFVATANAILLAEAIPIFMDIGDDYLMEPEFLGRHKVYPALERQGISSYPNLRTFVHWGGKPGISEKKFIEDAAQAVGATIKGKKTGGLGLAAAFSLHPLKNLNVMGDGGVVTTNDEGLAQEVRLLRNHGLQDRDTSIRIGYNSRLSTLQAIVALEGLANLEWVTERRIANAQKYDKGLKDVEEVTIPFRDSDIKQVYHLYQIEVKYRDELLKEFQEVGVEAKVHYPIPLHLQPSLRFLGYKAGDFPRAEAFAANHITLPVHQYLQDWQIESVILVIKRFYQQHR